jgi:hypothetical protein
VDRGEVDHKLRYEAIDVEWSLHVALNETDGGGRVPPRWRDVGDDNLSVTLLRQISG